MRPARLPGAFLLALVLAGGAGAATGPQTVQVPEVEVRSGPSMKYYPTVKLRRGDVVEVVREEADGWMAIKPPARSFSWIDRRMVEEHGPTAMVKEDTPVRVGSWLFRDEPNVARFRAPRGSQVTIFGTRLATGSDGAVYVSIMPLPTEERYIPRQAIEPPPPPAPVRANPVTGNAPSDGTRWQQALQAEQAGNVEEAMRLYGALGTEGANSNPGLAAECNRRAQWLHDTRMGYASGASPVPRAPDSRPALATPPWSPVNTIPTGQTTSQYTSGPPAAAPAPAPALPTAAPAPAAPPPAPAAMPSAVATRSGPGFLSRAGFPMDGKPLYRLESSAGQLRLYVTAQPGLNLEPYVHHNVELYGPTVYHGALKTNYMVVERVYPMP
jgi:hypothetical protein